MFQRTNILLLTVAALAPLVAAMGPNGDNNLLVPWAAAAGCSVSYLLYDALLKRSLRPTFLSIQVLAQVSSMNTQNAATELPSLIPQMKRIPMEQISNIQESGDLLWEGSTKGETLETGWFVAGKRTKSMVVHVGEQQQIQVFAPKAAWATPKDTSISKLLSAKKSCSVVQDLHDRLAWQEFLKDSLSSTSSETKLKPGRYRFVYRETVNVEEYIGMIAQKRGLTKLRFAKDSILVLEEDGQCYMEDYFRLYGIFPMNTHNTGEWSQEKAVWDKNQVRFGWKGIFGRTKEMEVVTKILRESPWDLKPCSFDDDREGVLFYRHRAGWLIWEKVG
ncbi:expressed unknown protein [Seminavis robusta]|uniref:Uncharacterized protein n=1 Tax=Seminavis robusta TaxID=568900 RepID=A0A9N8E5F3_9STRA|nr:expressed unknown protein [Seminavis robusta]|eukprot:Sro691_g187910.1 n/a (333) ;mRNA; r:38566-39564